MTNLKRTLLIATLLLLAAAVVFAAQTAPAATKDPVATALRDILPGQQKHAVVAVAAMPADKLNYKPTADQRTFGQLVVPMTETNYLLCSKATAFSAPKLEDLKDSDSKDKLVAALNASFEFCSDVLAKMDDSKLTETAEGFGEKQVTRAWFSVILVGAWEDDYTETAMYPRLNSVLPPDCQEIGVGGYPRRV